jgi:hypothetical protein
VVLAMAMHTYKGAYGQLPPAVVYGEDGKPLLSWRVLILPFLEQDDLYRQFKLDEAWDSPHNLALLPRMPVDYAPPARKAAKLPPYHTICQVFVGKGTAFEGPEGLRIPEDFPDGTTQTLLVVEAGQAVPWTKPEDIAYDPDQPLPELCTLFKNLFRARMADASGRWFRKSTSEATLRALITRNGGEEIGPDANW